MDVCLCQYCLFVMYVLVSKYFLKMDTEKLVEVEWFVDDICIKCESKTMCEKLSQTITKKILKKSL